MLITPGIGKRLRDERKRLKLNQTDFGLQAGISINTQKAYELETSSPTLRYLEAIEKMGVDLAYLITGQRRTHADLSPCLTSDEQYVIDCYRAIPPDSQGTLYRVSEAMRAAYRTDKKETP